MTKIVYNACYGGFGLSKEALLLYAEKKGWTLYPEKDMSLYRYWTIPEDHPHRVFWNENNPKFYILPEETRIQLNNIYRNNVLYDMDIERTDSDLVAVVEELGSEKASGDCAKLAIEELEPGTLYRITEYDGYESIETKFDIDWRVA